MMFSKLAATLPVLFALSSAMILEHGVAAHGEMGSWDLGPISDNHKILSVPSTKSACEKEDEADCTEFCKASEQTATCTAAGNKITCSCKGGKSETNCEEKCLFCMPDKSALEEATRIVKLGGWMKEDL